MALVAYGNSDSDSDYEDDPPAPDIKRNTQDSSSSSSSKTASLLPESTATDELTISSLTFNLPPPKQPSAVLSNRSLVEEADDEFLHKKSVAAEKPPPPPTILNAKKTSGGTVKIMLPALSTFGEHKVKEKPMAGAQLPASARPTGLIGMLPRPKSESNPFGKGSASGSKSSLVPDSISRPKAVARPSVVTKPMQAKTSSAPSTVLPSAKSDSDNSDDEDFFSLNTELDLPEVSASEISAMVASKSAQMNLAAKKRQQQFQSHDPSEAPVESTTAEEPSTTNASAAAPSAIDQQAMRALCGTRSRRGQEPINIIDISGDQVMPDRDEWMRTQLTASTEYQPRGLVDQDPGAGTKRKHQITYLAHQAKANEAELQAMWAANRHTKRQTQNKYGF